MPRVVRGGLIQATLCEPVTSPVEKIKRAMIDKHVALIAQAAGQGATGCLSAGAVLRPLLLRRAGTKWYNLTEKIPDGPTTKLMCELARKHGIVMVVPLYEEDLAGVYYNCAAVIDADGSYLGKFRKMHIPHCAPGFWEKFYFRPGNLGYPVFTTRAGKIGVYICYDRHFPEGARCLGLNGAEIVFNPSATVAGLSEYLWKLEQPAHAVAISTSSAPSIGQASKIRGALANFMDRAISATRAGSFWQPPASATPTTSSSPTWTST